VGAVTPCCTYLLVFSFKGSTTCCPQYWGLSLCFLWRVLLLQLWRVLLVHLWKSCCLLLWGFAVLAAAVSSILFMVYFLENCPTVHIDRDQTKLEV
jgi:hypothetical protein